MGERRGFLVSRMDALEGLGSDLETQPSNDFDDSGEKKLPRLLAARDYFIGILQEIVRRGIKLERVATKRSGIRMRT